MRANFGRLMAAIIVTWSSAALAEDYPVMCVQQHLADAGYAVGSVDGMLGPKTVGHAEDFAAAHPDLELPSLTRDSAAEWCHRLGAVEGDPEKAVQNGDMNIYAPGEIDRLPEGAIAPGGSIPAEVISGFGQVGRSTVSNAKAYGLAVVPDPSGGDGSALRFEVRPGDCGQEQDGNFDYCARGQEGVIVHTDTIMEDGENYTLSFEVLLEGPKWPSSPGSVVLVEFGQPEFDDQLRFTTNGLQMNKGNASPTLVTAATDAFDRWLRVDIDVLWSSDEDGYFSLSLDGEDKVNYEGVTITEGEVRVSFGIRRDGFKDQTTIVYFKNVLLTLVE